MAKRVSDEIAGSTQLGGTFAGICPHRGFISATYTCFEESLATPYYSDPRKALLLHSSDVVVCLLSLAVSREGMFHSFPSEFAETFDAHRIQPLARSEDT
jgi:hypothetical protein